MLISYAVVYKYLRETRALTPAPNGGWALQLLILWYTIVYVHSERSAGVQAGGFAADVSNDSTRRTTTTTTRCEETFVMCCQRVL